MNNYYALSKCKKTIKMKPLTLPSPLRGED
jgi:hypothetical protein